MAAHRKRPRLRLARSGGTTQTGLAKNSRKESRKQRRRAAEPFFEPLVFGQQGTRKHRRTKGKRCKIKKRRNHRNANIVDVEDHECCTFFGRFSGQSEHLDNPLVYVIFSGRVSVD